jgi:hypothetical protein
MVKDNGWIILYNMEIVRLYRHKLPHIVTENLLPDTLFDSGFATWRGVYPGDHFDSEEERQALAKLAKKDPKKYFKDITTWSIKRMERLRKDGWRKARSKCLADNELWSDETETTCTECGNLINMQ